MRWPICLNDESGMTMADPTIFGAMLRRSSLPRADSVMLLPPNAPLARFEDAFKGCDELVLYDSQGDGWHPFAFDPPSNYVSPGDPGANL